MATLINETFNAFHHVFHDLPDRRTDDWLLMNSVWMPVSISAIYVYFVKYWGPRLMKDREPFKLDTVIAIYNFVQMLWCLQLFYNGYTVGWGTKYRLFGEPVNYSNDPEAIRIAVGIWQYYILKIVDLLDTVFFVLRKKDRQVTFLHVYHHAGMVVISWFVARYVAGGHTTLVGATNCFVHVFMYGYYLLAVLRPEMKNSVWIKKHITHLQMFQFVYLFFHSLPVILMKNSKFPKIMALLYMAQSVAMFFLFANFYVKSYLKTKKKAT